MALDGWLQMLHMDGFRWFQITTEIYNSMIVSMVIYITNIYTCIWYYMVIHIQC